MKAKRTWVLVADGARGRILKRDSPATGLKAWPEGEFSHEVHRTRELGADRPGRVYERANAAHHAIEPHADWSRQEKQQFARLLAEFLEKGAQRDAFDRLILVAPPRALGDLRASLGRHARERLAGELAHDLTELSPPDIEARLIRAELL